ncbi:MAG: pantoate--beta-alanine ligase [Ignavibacteriales bacterium]|nr:pantoate--beta-alanine ligase [Ignavibacteriales bacterium]
MKTVTTIREMQEISNEIIISGKSIGFVPTMGFLHEGHLSLVKASKSENDITIVSIFVNPTQFGPNEDLSKYPRDFNRDESLLSENGVDYIFYPNVDEIYPNGFQTYVVQEKISSLLEGAIRPVHFRGVTTIVSILFNIVKPRRAYFGQKDAQQCAVLKRMVTDLCFDLEMHICPIVREPDGLAMSSRNVYLSLQERMDALVLSRSLNTAAGIIKSGERDCAKIKSEAMSILTQVPSASPDYFEIVDFDTFETVTTLNSKKSYFLLTACKIGKTRLIDNQLIHL